ncbi:MAG: M23 family metallopeptidase [Oscillospiraceae bacterium]|nr:M23 family metallopeptidase [Oscillospiraceae bacterium]
MKKTANAGASGKGFYAALSLSVAMVGAACWYAYTGTGKQMPETAESSIRAEYTAPLMTSAGGPQTQTTAQTTTVTTTARPQTTAASPEAEEAAALLHKTTTEKTTTVTAETAAPVEKPVMPVAGDVIEPFSSGELVKSKTTGIWQTHNGIDIAAAPGTEVCTVMDGTVVEVDRDALWGICVTMLHDDGTLTKYCGLNEGLKAEPGQVLPRGTVIGAVGDTNEAESSVQPHLHFEVRQNDRYVDPAGYLGISTQTETTTAE